MQLVAMAVAAGIAFAANGCGASLPSAAQEDDVKAYALEVNACIDKATTLEESRVCRDKVRAAHGRPAK